jgi:hypothetical protein
MALEFILLIAVFLWCGCVVAISFMESWLKFRAPGVTLSVGLSIGKLVFNALNKIEWFFALIIAASFFLQVQTINTSIFVCFAVPSLLLAMQTFWLLPKLDERANAVIEGKTIASSALHWYFVVAEVVKLASLFVLGFQLFQMFVSR